MKIIRLYILSLITIIMLSGCKAGKNQTVKFEKKDRAPSSVVEISEGLQDIVKDTEKVEKILDGTDFEVEKAEMEKAKEKEKAKEENKATGSDSGQGDDGGQQGSQDSKGTSQSGNQSKDTENKEQKKPEDKEEMLLNAWEKIDKKIEEVHKKWNEYEAEGMKKGVTADRATKFKESLNALTKSIEDRRLIDIYDYSSQSMLNLGYMFELYKDETLGEINKIKYATYQSYLRAMVGKNTEASESLKDLDQEINKIRLKLEKDNSKIKILDKVNLSIGDMSKSLKEDSIKLTRIKKDIIIKNLEELGK